MKVQLMVVKKEYVSEETFARDYHLLKRGDYVGSTRTHTSYIPHILTYLCVCVLMKESLELQLVQIAENASLYLTKFKF